MKRTVPLLITAIAGFVLIGAFFIPAYQGWGEDTAVWFDILASIAFLLGGGNLLKVHLKKVSDRQRGWGYSGVTIIAFLATLFVGLAKLGTSPAANSEYFGQSFTPVPLAILPEFRVPGTIPLRADGKPLPASVRQQLRQEGDEIVFRGWMQPNQASDLVAWQDTLEWHCLVERLDAAAQPPESLRGKLSYYVDHASLSFSGYMNDADHDALTELFPGNEIGLQAVERLTDAARRETSVFVGTTPPDLTIPASSSAYLAMADGSLTLRGPMSSGLRDRLADDWSNFPRVRPMTAAQQQELIRQIDTLGTPLTEPQQRAVSTAANSIWTPELLEGVLDSAGQPQRVPYSACEMQAQLQAGASEIVSSRLVGEPIILNDQQRAELTRFASDPTMSVDVLISALREAGELNDAQESALRAFIDEQPTVARWKRDLYFELLLAAGEGDRAKLGPEQERFLLDDFRGAFAWQYTVGQLFTRAHVPMYPWSGGYADPGSPFWWAYTYLFQPLTATMFALLAFYVASAAFRAFRAKNVEATLLLGTAFIILLGRTFAGVWLTAWLPDWLSAFKIDQLSVYIMTIFNTAGNRAIMIGIALGIASTSLKVLLGVDRSYLGSGDD